MKTAKFQLGLNVSMIGSKGLTQEQKQAVLNMEEGKTATIDLEDWIKSQLKLGKFKNMPLHISSSGSLLVNLCDKAELQIKPAEVAPKENLSPTEELLRSLSL